MTGIVIPTYNEADNIPTLFEGLAPVGAQIIIGSTDGMAEVAAAAGAKVIQRGSKQGLASAYVRGMSEAIHSAWTPSSRWTPTLSPALRCAAPDRRPRSSGSRPRFALGRGWRHEKLGGQSTVATASGRYARTLLGLPFRD